MMHTAGMRIGGPRSWPLGRPATRLAMVLAVLGAGVALPAPARATGFTVQAAVHSWIFSPDVVYVGTGDTVVWTNTDAPSQSSHTITADDGSFDSGPIPPGGTFSHTFATAGAVTVHDKFKPPQIFQRQHTVMVQSSAETPNVFVRDDPYASVSCMVSVQLTRPTPVTATVAYNTKNGTARAKSDYVATTGTLSFAPGEAQKTITIQLVPRSGNDRRGEYFSVELSAPTNLNITDNSATCTIAIGDG